MTKYAGETDGRAPEGAPPRDRERDRSELSRHQALKFRLMCPEQSQSHQDGETRELEDDIFVRAPDGVELLSVVDIY
jgi:hypothetical protein